MANQLRLPNAAVTAPPAGGSGKKVAIAILIVIGSAVLALLAAWGVMVAIYQLNPPPCDPWDCNSFDVAEVIWFGLLAGIAAFVGFMMLGFKRFAR